MPISISSEDNIAYLQRFLPHNKARGMIAEISLAHELGLVGEPTIEKLIVGGMATLTTNRPFAKLSLHRSCTTGTVSVC